LICISEDVAEITRAKFMELVPGRSKFPECKSLHLGADQFFAPSSCGMPENYENILSKISSKPSFLMVGTIEPRKGHRQILDAFDILWKRKFQVNLVIVGKQGWDVSELINKIQAHSQSDVSLFWLQNISDEFLDYVYKSCICLIAASEAEGFGLPLIEAAHHKIPILARDLKVFREVAGDNASYFNGGSSFDYANSIEQWLLKYNSGNYIKSDNMDYLNWSQHVEKLTTLLLKTNKM
jgi:glycosyltransferase involved in cell wall biosynthesis